MRISDWSSDVCSSDLGCSRDSPSGAEPPLIEAEGVEIPEEKERGEGREDRYSGEVKMLWLSGDQAPGSDDQPHGGSGGCGVHEQSDPIAPAAKRADDDCQGKRGFEGRSEEHTSELQSLMRISYAVICLTKKNTLTVA